MGRGRGKQTRIQKFGIRIKTRIWRGCGAAWGKEKMSAESRIRKSDAWRHRENPYERVKRAGAKYSRSLRRDFFALARPRIPPAKVLNVFSTKGCSPKGQPTEETAFKSLAAPRSGS